MSMTKRFLLHGKMLTAQGNTTTNLLFLNKLEKSKIFINSGK
jgi:hypothetical protein